MLCSKCNQKGILNNAGGKDFYYCRTCKTEILLEEVKPATEMIDIEEIIKLLDAEKIDGDTAAYFNFPSNDPNDYDDSPSDDDEDEDYDSMFNVGPTSDLRVYKAKRIRRDGDTVMLEMTIDGVNWFTYGII